jgi:hypothetical protein
LGPWLRRSRCSEDWKVRKFAVLYIALIVVFGFIFLIPAGIAVVRGHGSRGRWDNILVGLFTGAASVGLVTVYVALVLILVPAILVSGVSWLAVFGGGVAISAVMIRVTRDWLR